MRFIPSAAARRGALLATALLISGCDLQKEISLSMAKDAVLSECFGQFTNRCNAKNIRFNILLLRSSTPENWIPFKEVTTKEQMVELFGADGWAMFEASVHSALGTLIKELESVRPGWFTRTVLGDRQPLGGGVRAFLNGNDLDPVRDAIQKDFARRLKAAGWSPSPEVAARLSGATTTGDPSTEAAPATPSPQPSTDPATAPSGWQLVQQQITSDPEGYVRNCMEHYLESAQQLGGMSRAEALEQNPTLEGSCRQELTDLQNCMKLDPVAGERCFDAFTQNAE